MLQKKKRIKKSEINKRKAQKYECYSSQTQNKKS